MRRDSGRSEGFSLIELLVVIAIIMLLCGTILPSLSRAKDLARIVACEAKLYALTRAWNAYNHDHDGWMCSGHTYKWDQSPTLDERNWLDTHPNAAIQTVEDIENGVLWPYTRNLEMYYCESDQSEQNSARKHIVSYSMNDYLGGGSGADAGGGYSPVWQYDFIPRLADVFVFLEEEDPRGWNKGSFMCHLVREQFDDVPAAWHLDGMNISFADGHVEYWKWQDQRTLELRSLNTPSPDNPDLARLTAAWFPRWLGFGKTVN